MYSVNKIVTTSTKSVLITSKYISIKTASGVCRSCCRTQAMYARLSTFDFRCHNSSLNVSDCCGVRLCSIVGPFDYRTFDCVRFTKFFWVRLSSITERSISYAGRRESSPHSFVGFIVVVEEIYTSVACDFDDIWAYNVCFLQLADCCCSYTMIRTLFSRLLQGYGLFSLCYLRYFRPLV